jgi:hypothetical protein
MLLALAGCGPSKEEKQSAECLTADWYAIGYEDGSRGVAPEYFSKHRKTCALYGVTADLTAWLAGRDEGLLNYCKPQNGYRLGSNGYRYENVCPPNLEGPFVDAHTDGFGLYQRRVAAQNAANRLSNALQRALDLEHIITEKTTAMFSPNTPMLEKPAIGIEIKQLTQEKIELEKSIPQLQADYDAAQRDYSEYRASIAARYSS